MVLEAVLTTIKAKNAWRQTVARVVKSEMSVRGVKYQALSQRLEEIGVEQPRSGDQRNPNSLKVTYPKATFKLKKF